ncbi:HWE histidine kinase domain-containing protein [Gellertiella hungarica]|uniref:HWE histidine kinase domain-containing protein n=1 Tax=Gellertiella hungarica TaxID=1572859 RepID=UPI0035EC76FC
MARQTGVHAASVPDFSATLEGRLQALSRAHDQSISGASSRSLARIVESEAVLYRPQRQPDRLRVHGPEIALDERASGAVALVIHEMMTNAAKYGALSTPGGTLGVSWTIRDDGSCSIEWLERGGPTVSEPSAQGFGTKLIASCMEYDLGGEADMRFVPDGLQATLVIPAAYVVAEVPRDTVLEETSAQNADLSGSHILVVEDQALIAMEIEDTLRAMGATVTLAAHVRDALGVLDQATPNLALLDFNLGQGTSEEIAVRLSDLGIPFLFATGYGDRLVIPERFQDTPIIGKPFEGRELGRAILQVLKRPAI